MKTLYPAAQIAPLNSGTFGQVQLAKVRETGEKVAIKLLARGHKVSLVRKLSGGT